MTELTASGAARAAATNATSVPPVMAMTQGSGCPPLGDTRVRRLENMEKVTLLGRERTLLSAQVCAAVRKAKAGALSRKVRVAGRRYEGGGSGSARRARLALSDRGGLGRAVVLLVCRVGARGPSLGAHGGRSEEHTSELQS